MEGLIYRRTLSHFVDALAASFVRSIINYSNSMAIQGCATRRGLRALETLTSVRAVSSGTNGVAEGLCLQVYKRSFFFITIVTLNMHTRLVKIMPYKFLTLIQSSIFAISANC